MTNRHLPRPNKLSPWRNAMHEVALVDLSGLRPVEDLQVADLPPKAKASRSIFHPPRKLDQLLTTKVQRGLLDQERAWGVTARSTTNAQFSTTLESAPAGSASHSVKLMLMSCSGTAAKPWRGLSLKPAELSTNRFGTGGQQSRAIAPKRFGERKT